jgi:hypothetical protein
LHQKALPSMQVSFACKQSLAKQALGALKCPAFDEVGIVRHQNFTDVVRVVCEKHMLPAHSKRRKVAVLMCEALKKGKGFPSKPEEIQRKRTVPGARYWINGQ